MLFAEPYVFLSSSKNASAISERYTKTNFWLYARSAIVRYTIPCLVMKLAKANRNVSIPASKRIFVNCLSHLLDLVVFDVHGALDVADEVF